LDLFERPNYRQTQKEFWKLAVSYYLLAGETFWYLQKKNPNDQIPESMVNLRPDHVQILLSQDKQEIVGYEFNAPDGTVIKLPTDSILHIKNIDPVNPLRGIGVVRPATQRIITEQEASKHQSETFRNQGRPDIAIFTNVDNLTEEATQLAREKWQKVYGKDNGSQAGFFGSEVKDLKLLNVSPKEMDFINSQQFLREDILASLRIPIEMIKSEVNYANSKTARINYIKEACLPVLDAFLDVINNKFLINREEDKFFTYEPPVQEDREILLKEATELKRAGIITVNEARQLMNYEDVDGGDELSESSAFTLAMKNARIRKVAKTLMKKRKVLLRKFDAVEALTELYEAENQVKRERNSVFHTAEMKEKYIKAWNDNIDKRALSFKETIDVYNDGLYKRIMKQMKDFGVNPDSIFNVGDEMRTAKNIFVPMMQSMFKRIGQETLDSVANGFEKSFKTKASENFFTADAMLQALENRAEFFVGSMLDTDWKQMKSIILQGMSDGLGVAEIGRKLREYFDDMSVSRAKTIARTETGRLMSMATNEAYNQSEIVTGKEWLTAQDNNVRDIVGTINDHQINHGKIVDTRGTFPNGEEYPGQLTINCRCALAPAV
jgi:HK97 family phage portal protein